MKPFLHLISRHDAKQANLKKYFTGIPCTAGHLCEKYVSNHLCIECYKAWIQNNKNKIDPTNIHNFSQSFPTPSNLKLIYKITNLSSKKSYIGQTNDLRRRWEQHCSKNSKCTSLNKAIQKYGAGNFSIEILLSNLSQEEADKYEQQLIWWYGTIRNGYNITPGGGGTGVGASNHMFGRAGTKHHNFKKKWNKPHPKSKLTPLQHEEIKQKHSDGILQTTLASLYGVSLPTINSIIRQKKIFIPTTEETAIIDLYRTNNFTQKQIAELFNCTRHRIQRIIAKQNQLL